MQGIDQPAAARSGGVQPAAERLHALRQGRGTRPPICPGVGPGAAGWPKTPSRGVSRISSMRESPPNYLFLRKEGPRGPNGNSQKRKLQMVTRHIIHAFCQKVKTLTGKGGNPRQLKVKAQPTRHIVGGFQKDVLLLPEGEMVRAEQQKDLSTLTGTKSPTASFLVPRGTGGDGGSPPIAGKSPESLKETPDLWRVVRPARR